MNGLRWLALLTFVFCLDRAANGQSTAILTGSVTDPSGAIVTGVLVQCWNTETDLRMSATSNQEGLFRFPDLPVGPYEISISRAGFETLVRSGVRLYTGQVVELKLALQVGQPGQKVEVIGAAPLV